MSMPPPSRVYEGEPKATITPTRWGYSVNVTWGLMGLSTAPWWRLTRKGAERKARRVIAWWKAEEARSNQSWTLP